MKECTKNRIKNQINKNTIALLKSILHDNRTNYRYQSVYIYEHISEFRSSHSYFNNHN